MVDARSLPSVASFQAHLTGLLQLGQDIKPNGAMEPVLVLDDVQKPMKEILASVEATGHTGFAAVETACRDSFYDMLAVHKITDPAFGTVWNLLDIVTILSDLGHCEPGLGFWLVEELLDSQTIDGCRIVFDYLDSRRERLIAHNFKQKSLIILRACNELLRRLSRAEDTVFCGRVFIFLFQSFPLGDRSSVNLRGEYHVENVTVFENLPAQQDYEQSDDIMDIDQTKTEQGIKLITSEPDIQAPDPDTAQQPLVVKMMEGESIQKVEEKSITETRSEMDALYTTFWSLQRYFSQPNILFTADGLAQFKINIAKTMETFQQVQIHHQSRSATKISPESQAGTKRKRRTADDEAAGSFNPKYLTSRDLFDLEIGDLAFRRHILVQTLILLDFLLSLTPKSKLKLEKAPNKSVLYSYTLSVEDTVWATSLRNEVGVYLQQGPEGKFYYRMVDTVLSRDKNWVRWKAEGCPPIARGRISAQDFADAEKAAEKICTNKRLRPTAMGTLDLSFMTNSEGKEGLEKLKNPIRYTLPTVESFKSRIETDEFDIEMAKTEDEKASATEAKASKLWRTLRIASKNKLNVFDKIDDGKNLQPLFEPEALDEENRQPLAQSNVNDDDNSKADTMTMSHHIDKEESNAKEEG